MIIITYYEVAKKTLKKIDIQNGKILWRDIWKKTSKII